MISGKQESTWIFQLNDLDPKVQQDAIRALKNAPSSVVESAKPQLLAIASKGTGVSTEAVILLANKLLDVRPEFASLYLRPTHMTHGIPDGGGEAIIALSLDHPDIAMKELKRRLAEATYPADIEELKMIQTAMTTSQPEDSSEDLNSSEIHGPQDNRGHSDP